MSRAAARSTVATPLISTMPRSPAVRPRARVRRRAPSRSRSTPWATVAAISPERGNVGIQLEFNYVNGRLFKQATKPFLGDYNAVAAPAFRLSQGGAWVSNQGALGSDPGPKDPTFQTFWADNRDVRSNVFTQTACVDGAAPGSGGVSGVLLLHAGRCRPARIPRRNGFQRHGRVHARFRSASRRSPRTYCPPLFFFFFFPPTKESGTPEERRPSATHATSPTTRSISRP